MDLRLERSARLYGEEAIEKLKKAHVAVFGIGGVGCYAIEALARAGVGELTVVDCDVFEVSNLNRQLYATLDTIGDMKTSTAKARILQINEKAKVNTFNFLVLETNIKDIDFSKFDYVIDAIDNVSGKTGIISECKANGVKVISVMGTGNKINPTAFKVDDISKTKVCPLCRVMRKILKDKNLTDVKVVYSEEEPIVTNNREPSSNSFVPAIAGLIASGTVINDLIKQG